MIKLRVKDLLEENNKTKYWLYKQMGMSYQNFSKMINNQTKSIRYENIEIGVLKYVRLLSKNYFGKGLTTVNSIGRVYCPVTNEYGQKVASPHWINLVNTARNKYNSYTQDITIEDIINY